VGEARIYKVNPQSFLTAEHKKIKDFRAQKILNFGGNQIGAVVRTEKKLLFWRAGEIVFSLCIYLL